MTKPDIYINNFITATSVATCLIFGFTLFNGANSTGLFKPKNQVVEKVLITDYQAANNGCDGLVGSEKTVCDSNAEIAQDDLKVDLDSNFESSVQNRNMDKYGEFYQDKTLTFESFDYKDNLFISVEFEDIYHVKA